MVFYFYFFNLIIDNFFHFCKSIMTLIALNIVQYNYLFKSHLIFREYVDICVSLIGHLKVDKFES